MVRLANSDRVSAAIRKKLLNQYRRLKKTLGRQPMYSEFLSVTKYSSKAVTTLFGRPGWFRLIIQAEGRTYRKNRMNPNNLGISKKQLLRSYRTLKELLQKQPTITEYYGYFGNLYRELDKTFGRPCWKNMLKEAGDHARQGPRKGMSRDTFIAQYAALKNKLGKLPTFREYYRATGHGDGTLSRYFGTPGWRNLVLGAGDLPRLSDKDDQTRKRELISSYLSLKKRLGRQPSLKEFIHILKISLSIIDRLFGKPGWKNMLKHVGDKIMYGGRARLGEQHLIDHYLKLKQKLGRIPEYREYADHAKHYVGSLITHFGRPGWTNLLKKVGDYQS